MNRRIKSRRHSERSWSTVILLPDFWWKLRSLFRKTEIMFCWNADEYMVRGLHGQQMFAIGGLPTKIREEVEAREAKQLALAALQTASETGAGRAT
jgi:hypothetical protein